MRKKSCRFLQNLINKKEKQGNKKILITCQFFFKEAIVIKKKILINI